jgi:hypothetical protein
MMKFSQFLKSSSGELSSRRLGYLSTIPATIFGTFYLCNELIDKGAAEPAVNLWSSFLIFSAVLGGFVSADVVISIIKILKGKNDQNDN